MYFWVGLEFSFLNSTSKGERENRDANTVAVVVEAHLHFDI